MSICSEKRDNEPGSVQIIRHIKKAETPMTDVRDLMINILKQYQRADNIAHSLGVLEKNSSFTDHVSWCALVSKIDKKKEELGKVGKNHLLETLEYLDKVSVSIKDNVINEIQKVRDKWMLRVLMADIAAFLLAVASVVLILLWSGVSLDKNTFMLAISERPIFYSLSAIILLVTSFAFHFFCRHWMLRLMIEKNQNNLLPGMSMSRALVRNARTWHSIFRPQPVGWNLWQKKRLDMLRVQVAKLREKMADVLAHYPENKPEESRAA